jgi:hypothetical protein
LLQVGEMPIRSEVASIGVLQGAAKSISGEKCQYESTNAGYLLGPSRPSICDPENGGSWWAILKGAFEAGCTGADADDRGE